MKQRAWLRIEFDRKDLLWPYVLFRKINEIDDDDDDDDDESTPLEIETTGGKSWKRPRFTMNFSAKKEEEEEEEEEED
ncbi:hypothetical protein ANN_21931 [Periplaneta americana]|uniref:Uncharacterized protein n=1 Tax=Periplaneta americana TaxID=6978 RepID=A0ABQ8S7Q9_PERAM|nr:hypothetical protein ANN_21931 [Periplaneta americana]